MSRTRCFTILLGASCALCLSACSTTYDRYLTGAVTIDGKRHQLVRQKIEPGSTMSDGRIREDTYHAEDPDYVIRIRRVPRQDYRNDLASGVWIKSAGSAGFTELRGEARFGDQYGDQVRIDAASADRRYGLEADLAARTGVSFEPVLTLAMFGGASPARVREDR